MDVADDLRLLLRKEIELARIELLDGIKAQLIGAGLVIVAALAILPALMFLVFAGVFWMPFSPEVAFAIVGFAMIAVAAIVVLVGIRVMKSRKPKLDKSVASIKEDVRWAREQLTS
jgi:hypothetical protein